MSIAEKLTAIAENQQNVYDAGYEKGKAEGGTGGTDYLYYSTTAQFPNLNLFGKTNVVIDMPLLTQAAEMFRPSRASEENLNRTVEHITINGEGAKPTSINMMFYFSDIWDEKNPLKHITLNFDTSKVTYANNVFGSLVQLKTVDGKALDFSSISSSSTIRIFYGSANVEYARFVPNTIKCNLNVSDSRAFTTETIQSIIDGLADVTDGTAKTLTLHSTVGAKLTDEQKATITAKNWTLVY